VGVVLVVCVVGGVRGIDGGSGVLGECGAGCVTRGWGD